MKTLIAYASKTGTSEKCARMLAERIPDATLCDLCREKPDPNAYDQVIVGGGVRMGALHVDARQYLDGCKPILLQKRLGLFLCAGFAEKAGRNLCKQRRPRAARPRRRLRLLRRRDRHGQSCAALKS